ncbi:MAG TPA: nitroreductase family deazaflavin-dependent oxidoreductase [Dehalococcoidia bacterium]|nr:nitroreductase family deazaflavin-dependent oxidoreductase [Dehalococcoidia bacterium]
MFSQEVRNALSNGSVIDITTKGRKSGEPRRIEIAFHNIDGRVYIAGMPRPRPRDWLANMEADPAFTFHLKRDVVADLPAKARPIKEGPERGQILTKVLANWRASNTQRVLEEGDVMKNSPLVEVTFDQ